MENLAANKAETSNLTQEKILKQLISHETIRNMFRKIKAILKNNRSGVTTVEAQDEEGQWQVITDKANIEHECIKENIKRMTQAVQSPTMLQSQINLLGWKADSPLAQDILNGTYTNTDGLHPDIIDLIPYISTPTAIKNAPAISTQITTDEYKWAWHRSREFTSCGRSGLHFGHFRASSEDRDLCELDKWFIETALRTGYSLSRWHTGIDVMIPKKVDSNKVDKLRTIVLMEPDFNFTNKIIGKRVMANAEKAGTIAPEQFGSRKKKSSIIHAINKQLTTDILRQDKKNPF